MDYAEIYKSEVAPVLANFQAAPPLWVYGILAFLVLGGIAMLVFAPVKVKAGGAVLIFAAGFIGYMMMTSKKKAQNTIATYRVVRVIDKTEKKQVVRNTRGIMEPHFSYLLTVDSIEGGLFDDTGKIEGKVAEKNAGEEILVSKPVFNAVQKGETVTGIILPTANNAFHLVIRPDGEKIR